MQSQMGTSCGAREVREEGGRSVDKAWSEHMLLRALSSLNTWQLLAASGTLDSQRRWFGLPTIH